MSPESRSEIPSVYTAVAVEQRLYDNWMAKGYFSPSIDWNKKPFVIIMPPPNVTGELHLGHALTASLEDILARWHRMLGDPTLWLPGKDHAGIATQWVVEKLLAGEGASRHQLGRQRFVDRVWEWVREYGNTIDRQHQRLGASCDWSRLRFTLDPGPSRAVRATFFNLYRRGLVYRGERIINWCPRCATALSDLEVEHQEVEGKLYFLRYPLVIRSPYRPAGAEGYIVVATTRPETMLGDSGVAVHPDDSRFRSLVGRMVRLPIIGREIPVVADSAIDPRFGTGAVKVTPGHDPTDFDIGQRHRLPIITVIGQDGNMTAQAGPYSGQERSQCRQGVVDQLEAEGLLEKTEPYRHSVGHCQRCKTVVEPLVSLQWFMNVGRHDDPSSIAGRAYIAVAHNRIKIVPERFTRVYLNWLENIRDWCISRQLWWGHRIPVWYCPDCDHLTISVEDPTSCEGCGSSSLRQDPDVLDTWFSSGLWPHSTLGWPEDTEDFRYFHPTSVMETGYDILFFWVARMIMMGIENTGQEPFHTIFLHGLIRDAHGVKMSKTRGNVMNPLELINQYGTDAMRFALTTGTSPGNDLRLSESKLESARNFANKIWNASRYVMTSLGGAPDLRGWYDLTPVGTQPAVPLHREDRWIVSRLNRTVAAVNQSLEDFELGDAQQRLYDFIWDDFCDWYIEMAKIRLRSGAKPSPLPVLAHVLERTLRLLHPFMPFITEEVWQTLLTRLPQEGNQPESIMIASYPQVETARLDQQAEDEVDLVQQAIRAVRNTRAQLRIPAGQSVEAHVEIPFQPPLPSGNGGVQTIIQEEAEVVRALSRVQPLLILSGQGGTAASVPQRRGVTLVVDLLVLRIPLEGVVDLAAEQRRLGEELAECVKNLKRVESLVSNPAFRAKAKPEVIETEEERLQSLKERKARLEDILGQLG